MAKNIDKLAILLGAEVKGQIPEAERGGLGAARLPMAVATLRAQLEPSRGRRPGRPTNANWVHHPKVPMSRATQEKLKRLAARASAEGRKVSPMQLAAQLLEEAVARVSES